MRSWKPHNGRVRVLAFSPDGSTLASSGGTSPAIWLWDAPTGELKGTLEAHEARVVAIEFSPDGQHFATLDHHGQLLMWQNDLAHGQPIALLQWFPPEGPPAFMTFSPTSDRLVAANATSLEWWDHPTEPAQKPRIPTGANNRDRWSRNFCSICFTRDGQRLLVGSVDLEVWPLDLSGPVGLLRTNKGGGLRAITVSADGLRAAMILKNTVRICRLAELRWETTLWWGRDGVYTIAFTPDGRSLLTAGADGSVRFWDVRSWQETRRFDWGVGKVHVSAFAPDGLTCAAGGEKGQIVVWDVDS